jgi:hypothetical protein
MQDASQLDLDAAEQDERDLQIAVANAQRLMHDEGLRMFMTAQRKMGEHDAVYGTTLEARELNRVKVLVIDELRGLLEATAKVNQDRMDDDERAKALE